MTECYDCGKAGNIEGDDGNQYCQKCWDGEPRQVVRAHYSFYSTFVVPEGVDLKGEEVKEWWVKWDTLYIEMKDGTQYQVIPEYSAKDNDMKYPYDEAIEEEDIDNCYDESEYVTKS